MTTQAFIFVLAGVGLGAGCLGGETKDRCTAAEDCLEGLTCAEGVCKEATNNNGTYFGTVEPIAAESAGVTPAEGGSMIVATSTAGPLGCAIVGDAEASPAMASSAVYVLLAPTVSSHDVRCPSGVFAIKNDPPNCTYPYTSLKIRSECALYKQWNAAGAQVTNRLAIGGYVKSTPVVNPDDTITCTIDMGLTFEGGITIKKAFTFDYAQNGGTASVYCVQ
ncbi:MAG: hypothetical protein AB7L28_23195 [Kofleriaceae bacterium]